MTLHRQFTLQLAASKVDNSSYQSCHKVMYKALGAVKMGILLRDSSARLERISKLHENSSHAFPYSKHPFSRLSHCDRGSIIGRRIRRGRASCMQCGQCPSSSPSATKQRISFPVLLLAHSTRCSYNHPRNSRSDTAASVCQILFGRSEYG